MLARADLQINGVRVRAGDLVLLDNGAANHDAKIFPDPDRLDITRQAASHLTFGHGPRYCIGAPLARMALQAVFSRLLPRAYAWPCLSRSSRSTPAYSPGGLARLPVTW